MQSFYTEAITKVGLLDKLEDAQFNLILRKTDGSLKINISYAICDSFAQ